MKLEGQRGGAVVWAGEIREDFCEIRDLGCRLEGSRGRARGATVWGSWRPAWLGREPGRVRRSQQRPWKSASGIWTQDVVAKRSGRGGFREGFLPPLHLFLFPVDEGTCIGQKDPVGGEFPRTWQRKVAVASPGISFWFPDGDKSRPGSTTTSPSSVTSQKLQEMGWRWQERVFPPLPQRAACYKMHVVLA